MTKFNVFVVISLVLLGLGLLFNCTCNQNVIASQESVEFEVATPEEIFVEEEVVVEEVQEVEVENIDCATYVLDLSPRDLQEWQSVTGTIKNSAGKTAQTFQDNFYVTDFAVAENEVECFYYDANTTSVSNSVGSSTSGQGHYIVKSSDLTAGVFTLEWQGVETTNIDSTQNKLEITLPLYKEIVITSLNVFPDGQSYTDSENIVFVPTKGSEIVMALRLEK